MRTIPSPHGGLLHHQLDEQHEGARREHDRHPGARHFRHHAHGPGMGHGEDFERSERGERGERHARRHDVGHGEGFGRHGRRHNVGRGRNRLAAIASGRQGVPELANVAHEVRDATRNLLYRGTPDQLAEAQRLLEDTRRSLYLILAARPEAAAEADPDWTDDTSVADAPPEIG